jgi:hypothetical protein
MAAKVPVAVRLSPEKLSGVDELAKVRGVSRQQILEGFVDEGLDDSTRGVVDLPAAEDQVAAPVTPPAPQVVSSQSLMGLRQARLEKRS